MTGPDGGVAEVLGQLATPALYRSNAFRITGLPVTAEGAQIRREAERLRIASAIGSDITSGEQSSQEAQRRLRDPVQRLIDEFFWFWPDDGVGPDVAGDTTEVEARWQRLSDEDGAGDRSRAVARHNLAIATHLRALEPVPSGGDADHSETLWRQTFARWWTVLADDAVWRWLNDRTVEARDPRVGEATVEHLRLGLSRLLAGINATLAVTAAQAGDTAEAARQIRILEGSGLPGEVVTRARVDAAEPVSERLRRLCVSVQERADADPEAANVAARELLDAAEHLLGVVSSVLPAGHPAAEGLHDDVATRVRACVVVYGNGTDNWDECADLLERVGKIAASDATRALIADAIATVRGNQEFNERTKHCWFCKQRPPDPRTVYRLLMHGDVQVVLTGRKYRQLTVEIPRCASCRRRNGFALTSAFTGAAAILGAVGTFIWAWASGWELLPLLFLAGSAATVGVCLPLAGMIGTGVRPSDYPGVKRRKKEGWLQGSMPGANEGFSSVTTPELKPRDDRPRILPGDVKNGCRRCGCSLSITVSFKAGGVTNVSVECKSCDASYVLES